MVDEGDKGAASEGLKEKFDDQLEAVKIGGDFPGTKTGVGHVVILENERIKPTKEQREQIYGMGADDFGALSDDQLDAVVKTFVETETARYMDAYHRTVATYEKHLSNIQDYAPVEIADIAEGSMQAELAFVMDGNKREILQAIQDGKSAEVAIDDAYQSKIDRVIGGPMAHVAVELQQHRATIQHHIHPDKQLSTWDNIPKGSVVVTSSIPLSGLSHLLDHQTGRPVIDGIVTNQGSLQSHAAILINSMGIPYARIADEDMKRLKNGDQVIVSGTDNALYLNPSKKMLSKHCGIVSGQDEQRQKLLDASSAKRRVKTLDRETVNIHANFSASYEAPKVRAANPWGIGLYRTEIPDAMRGKDRASAADWKRIFRSNIEACAQDGQSHLGATIRTIDLDGDKSDLSYDARHKKQQDVTRTQLRALAELHHDLSEGGAKKPALYVMVPTIQDVEEMRAVQGVLDEEAEKAGVPSFKLGAMVEKPSIISDIKRMDVAFVSIGTNDLIHNLLGIKRFGGDSLERYDPTHTSVLKAFEKIVISAQERGIKHSICGDMASDERNTALLIGAGVNNMSVGVDSIPLIKAVASRVDSQQAQTLFETMKNTHDRAEREAMRDHFNLTQLGLARDGNLHDDWVPPQASWTWDHDAYQAGHLQIGANTGEPVHDSLDKD